MDLDHPSGEAPGAAGLAELRPAPGTAQTDAYYAREAQHLPFLRQKLSDTDRAHLLDALEQASRLDENRPDNLTILAGAALVAASLETGRPVSRFSSEDIGLLYSAVNEPGRPNTPVPDEGLYALADGSFEWRLCVPRPDTEKGPTYATGWVQLPATDLISTLVCKAEARLITLTERSTISDTSDLSDEPVSAFARWCYSVCRLQLNKPLLDGIERDLSHRMANAHLGDPAVANILTGHLSREMNATGYYSSVATSMVRAHFKRTLQSQLVPARFNRWDKTAGQDGTSNLRNDAHKREDSGTVGVTVKAGMETLEEIRTALDYGIRELKGRGRPDLARRQQLHNYLTLRVWLLTSIAVGARYANRPLINPEALLPGNLFLIADKRSQRSGGSDEDGFVAAEVQDRPGHLWSQVPPSTRIIALPEHVAEQIRVYGRYFREVVRNHVPEQSRWEPFFYVPRLRDGKVAAKPMWLRYVISDYHNRKLQVRQQYREGGADGWLPILAEIAGLRTGTDEQGRLDNRWRHFLRQQLIGKTPAEVTDAHLGHAQIGQDPWCHGAALDPVETWCRSRDAITEILPPEKWPVITAPSTLGAGALRLTSPHRRSRRIREEGSRASDFSGVGEQRERDKTGLHAVFNPEGFAGARAAFAVEEAHLRLLANIDGSMGDPVDCAQVLLSAVLWSGLLNRLDWANWLTAVAEALRGDPDRRIEQIVIASGSHPSTRTIYHDNLTIRLLQLWIPCQTSYERADVDANLNAWLARAGLSSHGEEIRKNLSVSLELRARLRFPAILVDYATGQVPSPPQGKRLWRSGAVKGAPPAAVAYFGTGAGSAYQDAFRNPFITDAKRTNPNGLWEVITRAQGRIAGIHKKSAALALNKNKQMSVFRRSLQQVFPDVLDVEDMGYNAFHKGMQMQDVFALVIKEITGDAARSKSKDYGRLPAKQFNPGYIRKITECFAILSELYANYEAAKEIRLGNLYVPIFLSFVKSDIGDVENRINKKLESYFNENYFQKGARISSLEDGVIFHARTLLCNALARIYKAWSTSTQPTQNEPAPASAQGSGVPEDDQKEVRALSERRLIKLTEYYAALAELGKWGRWQPAKPAGNVNAAAARRRSDITRICLILMYRAGLRPHEMSSLRMGDLSFYRREGDGVIERAELDIGANGYHRRKTRLSRRRLPLDVLLEPAELQFLFDYQQVRWIEIGGYGEDELLLSLGAKGITARAWGQPLKYSWLLEPVAAALLTAAKQYEGGPPDDPLTRSKDVGMICYHLRHTAATCWLATLLLPDDCERIPAPLPGITPDLISLDRKRRLAPRLLGQGSAGRAAAHAVARLLGHFDLSTLRNTYAHLMDWSLGAAVRRSAIQPPLPEEVLRDIATSDFWSRGEWNGHSVRKAAQRFHMSIEVHRDEVLQRKIALALAEYRLDRKGRPARADEMRLRASGYLDSFLAREIDGTANKPERIPPPNLSVHSCPERWQIVDLVIRAHKSGLDAEAIERQFGIACAESNLLIRKWSEITSMMKPVRRNRKENFKLKPTFQDIADPSWNNLASISLTNLADHPFADGFYALCHALWPSSGNNTALSLFRRQSRTQVLRILLTRRNQRTGIYDVRLRERTQAVRRWMKKLMLAFDPQGQNIKEIASEAAALGTTGGANDLIELAIQFHQIDLRLKFTPKPLSKVASRVRKSVQQQRRYFLYGIMLYAIDNYDDMRIFMQSNRLSWKAVQSITEYLKPDRDGYLNRTAELPPWVPARLYQLLSGAFYSQDPVRRSSSGCLDFMARDSDYDLPANAHLFRILSVTGEIATGYCIYDYDGHTVRQEVAGATLPALSPSAAIEISLPEGKVCYERRVPQEGGLMLHFDSDGPVASLMEILLKDYGHYDQAGRFWRVDDDDQADIIEARLCSRATRLRTIRRMGKVPLVG